MDDLSLDKNVEDVNTVNFSSFLCKNCNTIFFSDLDSFECINCGSNMIINDSTNIDKDYSFLSFNVSVDEASKVYRKNVCSNLFLKRQFESKKIIKSMKIVYIPSMLCDCLNRGKVSFEGRKKDEHNSLYERVFDVNCEYQKVLVSLYSKVDSNILDAISSFEYDDEINFNDINSTSFFASDTSLPEKNNSLKKITYKSTLKMIKDFLKYKTIKLKSNNLECEILKYKKVYIPVYIISRKKGNNYIKFVMNGQNGRYYLDYNLCKTKIIIFSIILFIFIFFSVYLLAILF